MPSGIEIAFKTVMLSLDELAAEADDRYDEGCVQQYDWEDGYNQANREELIAKSEQHFPMIYKYMRLCYGEEGALHVLWKGRKVGQVSCKHGVWQGDPLGMHSQSGTSGILCCAVVARH